MAYYFSPTDFSPTDVPRDEKLLLLPDRIDTNVVPFPMIHTPAAPVPSIRIQAPMTYAPNPNASAQQSPLSYHPSPSGSSRSPLLPPPIITNPVARRARWNCSWVWALFHFITSGSTAFIGWDMIAGCVLYDPNPLYDIERVCSCSTRTGVLFSVILALVSSIVLVSVRSRPRDHPHRYRVIGTFAVLVPVTSFLLGALGAFVTLGNLGPQGIAMLQVLSALCACFSILMAVLGNAF